MAEIMSSIKDVIFAICIIGFCFCAYLLYLAEQDLSTIKKELKQDQIIINQLDSIVSIKEDSLRLADEALDSFQEFVNMERIRVIDSLNNYYDGLSDNELKRAILENRRD